MEQSGAVADDRPGDAAPGAQVDIIIVNWNSGTLLANCLGSVAAHGGAAVGRTLVVDNGSADGSADVDVAGLDWTLIRTGANLGFGRACNLAARQAEAPFLLFFNPDAELRPGTLDQALRFMRDPANARVGVAGIRLVDEDGHVHRHCARFPTWRNFIGNSLGLTRLLKRRFPSMLMLDWDHGESRPVDHVMGAFYLIRRDLFERVGGFDNDYFVYLEDLDLSRRVYDAGYGIQYLVEPEAYHKQGGTSEKVKAHRLFYAMNSNMIYAWKHLSRPSALGVVGTTLLIEPVSRTVRALLRRSPEELWFTWRGFGMVYRDLPTTLRTLRGARGRAAGGVTR
ncbi:glycosyltransferase family 2 protein [uncultured Sphingomonas sp.]|uniref:glycosyltransferase family 2 protein n=1 Tax=uncultured Sphingomonas sp. TaxID=158754 RepID=UPI0035CB7DB8